jgi:hypothetical protein
MARATPQIFVFCHHKVGTILFYRTLTAIASRFGLTFQMHLGLVRTIDSEPDIILFPHSVLSADLASVNYRGVHLRRDPRDIWVSGYLYHRRCRERWCINTDFDVKGPILFPKIDFSVQHEPEWWKRDYLSRLGGLSYQQNLLALDRREGLRFELARYTQWTLSALTRWRPNPEILEMRLEDFSVAFDSAMRQVLTHFGFEGEGLKGALEIAANEDIRRMSDVQLRDSQHIHSRQLSKWRTFLTPDELEDFYLAFGDIVKNLGYGSESPAK